MLYALMINRMKFESWIIKKILKEKSLKIVTIDKTNQIEDSRKKKWKRTLNGTDANGNAYFPINGYCCSAVPKNCMNIFRTTWQLLFTNNNT